MPRRIKATVKTDVQPMNQPPVTSELITKNENQLSVFDYSQLSEPQIRKSLEIKGQMISIGKRVSDDLLELARLSKEQHDNLNSYALFIDWCNKELNYSKSVANRFLRVGTILVPNSELKKIPDSLSGLDAIASALLKADSEEAKQEITQAINEATEEKGKALTEKEINELPEVKKLKEELKAQQEAKKRLEEDLKEAKQGELFFQEKLDKKIDDYNDLQDSFVQKMQEIKTYEETIANQNKQIKELDSQVLQLDQELTELNQFQGQVEIEKEELDKRIKAEANVIVQAELEKERKALDKKEADLKAKEEKISKELKETQSLKNQVEREKDNLYRLNAWIDLISEFNQEFTRYNDRLKTISSLLIKLPNLLELSEKDRKIADQRIYSQMSAFNQNLDDFGKYNIRIQNAIRELDTSVLSVGSIDVEVKS